ncbi:MAG: putative zinc transporter msc2 [Phylliscum demangeonii]|nr:MAG: putative zinc transporter msc2 [Phylliscum demangeonii]
MASIDALISNGNRAYLGHGNRDRLRASHACQPASASVARTRSPLQMEVTYHHLESDVVARADPDAFPRYRDQEADVYAAPSRSNHTDAWRPQPLTASGKMEEEVEPQTAHLSAAVAYPLTGAPQNPSYKPRSRSNTASSVGPARHRHSALTRLLLDRVRPWPLLHSILAEKDSRRIFYFMSLNFGFMLVQTFYGVATGSLGLLSDSIHMLFDCLALLVGLCAAVMSKWPPSVRFPYGLGKMDTLAGFANGIFLMLISVEIVIEAIERLASGSQLKRIGELLTVSTLGLGVNLVGIMAFDHAHHGHGHSHGGHSHGHSHGGHDHGHGHSHDPASSPNHKHDHHPHDHDHDHAHDHAHESHSPHSHAPHSPGHPHSHSPGHGHGNENMHGIYLHILADTLGSVAVVFSTLLIHFYRWPGFDPLASCLIALLIFASAIPLVTSSAKTLLLTIPADTEYTLREALTGLSSLRGVASYCVPRFWLADGDGGGDGGGASGGDGVGTADGASPAVLGVIHVVAGRGFEGEEVRARVVDYLLGRGVDAVVQVEKEGEGRCWCGGGIGSVPGSRSPSVSQ